MGDYSLFEGRHPRRMDRNFLLTFGRIVRVDPNERLCDVKTFSPRKEMDDQHMAGCQWLAADFHIDGDESTAIPRVGSFVVLAIIDGEGFVLGAFRPIPKLGKTIGDNDPVVLREGDKILRTAGGNRVVIKSNGLIEVFSSETLKRVYFPTTSSIRDLCRNYSMQTDGGLLTWEDTDGATLWRGEFRTDILKTGALVDQKGAVEGTTVFRREVGASIGAPPFTVPIATYLEEIDLDGSHTATVGLAGFQVVTEVLPTGAASVTTPTASFTVSPLGDFTFENQGATVAVDALGNFSFKNPLVEITAGVDGNVKSFNQSTTISQTPEGKITLDATTAKIVIGAGQVEVGGPAGGLVDTLLKLLQKFDGVLTAIQAMTHMGNMGYPTSPPIDPSAYIDAQLTVQQLIVLVQATLGKI
jgi:hypothetical protein